MLQDCSQYQMCFEKSIDNFHPNKLLKKSVLYNFANVKVLFLLDLTRRLRKMHSPCQMPRKTPSARVWREIQQHIPSH